MPGDSDNDRHVFVLDGNNAEKMISLQFQHGGVYRYHLVQTSQAVVTPSERAAELVVLGEFAQVVQPGHVRAVMIWRIIRSK